MNYSLEQLIDKMKECQQTPYQTVYQHGVSVNQHARNLILGLKNNQPLDDWVLPDWLYNNKPFISNNLHEELVINQYTLYHDCGKYFCLTVDPEGKRHFPDHANVSKKVFLAAGGDPTASNLIGWDMDLHTLKAQEIDARCQKEWNSKDACTLLLVSFAELHSNAKMFGGYESTGFKIKWKQLDKRGKQICKFFNQEFI